ncbi:MAG: translocation/assembly module TamB domain-containing protein [Deltaproteobacteria bacterium]|nr:translocation/assembly module TamB domain-containing protein [Deltaproteobacteria bacterium]
MRALRHFLVLLVATVAMVALHVPGRHGRRSLREVLRVSLQAVPGRLTVDRVDRAGLDGIALRGIEYRDAHGHLIVRRGELETPALFALLRALAEGSPLPTVHVRAQEFIARPPVLEAHPRRAGRAPPPPTARFEAPSLVLRVDTVRLADGSVLARGVSLDGGLSVHGAALAVTVRGLSATLERPGVGPLQVTAQGRFASPDRVDATLRIEGPGVRCALRAEHQDGVQGVTIDRCQAARSTVEALLGVRDTIAPDTLDVEVRATLTRTFDARARITVRAGSSAVTVEASGDPWNVQGTLSTRHLDLHDLRADLPPTDIDGALAVRSSAPWLHQGSFQVEARGLTASVATVPLPPWSLRGAWVGPRLTVEDLQSEPLALHARATVDRDRGVESASGTLDLAGVDLAALPFARGRLTGRATAHASLAMEGARPVVAWTLEGANLATAGLRVGEVRSRGRLVLEGRAPSIDATVTARGAVLPGAPALDLDASVRGAVTEALEVRASGRLGALASVPLPACTFRVEGTVAQDRARGLLVALRAGEVRAGPASVGALGSLAVPPTGPRGLAGNLLLTTDTGATVRVSLAPERYAVDARELSLGWLSRLTGRTLPVGGRVDASVVVDPRSGLTERARLTLVDGTAGPFRGLRLEASLEPSGGALRTLRASLQGTGLALSTEVPFTLPRNPADPGAWLRGLGDGALRGSLDLASLRPLLPPATYLSGTVVVSGTLSHSDAHVPRVLLGFTAREALGGGTVGPLRLPAVVPLAVRGALCASLDPEALEQPHLALTVAVSRDPGVATAPPVGCDPDAELLPSPLLALHGTSEGQLTGASARRGAPPSGPPAQVDLTINVGPVTRAQWPLRGLANVALPPPRVPPETRLSSVVRVRGALRDPEVEAKVQVELPRVEELGLEEPTVLRADLRAVGGSETVRVGGSVRGRFTAETLAPTGTAPMTATATISFGLERWTDPRWLEHLLRPRATLDTQNFALERFGPLRSLGLRGQVEAHLIPGGERLDGWALELSLGGVRGVVGAEVEGPQRLSEPLQAAVRAVVESNAGGAAVRVCVRGTTLALRPDCAASATLPRGVRADLRLPLNAAGRQLSPRFEGLTGTVALHQFDVNALAPFLRGTVIASVGGSVSGELTWRPGASAPTGELTLRDGTLESWLLGAPVQRINAHATLAERELLIDTLHAAIGNGTLEGHGRWLPSRRGGTLDLDATLERFPAEQEGNTFGWVTGDLTLQARLLGDRTEATVTVHHADVLVQEEPPHELQALTGHPSVFVLGRTPLDPGAPEAVVPLDLRYSLETPVLVHTPGAFAVAVNSRGTVRLDASGMSVAGTLEAANRQGWYVFNGRRFLFDRLTVTMDGGNTLNPILDIAMHHDNAVLGTLRIGVAGRLRQPELTLQGDRHQNASQAELLAMIVTGRADYVSSSGSGDLTSAIARGTGNLVTSLALGVLTTTISRQVSFLPTLIVEPGDDRPGTYGAGIRVSPRLYIQLTSGAVPGASGAAAATASEYRVMVEYALGRALSLAGQVASSTTSGSRWGVDLNWLP